MPFSFLFFFINRSFTFQHIYSPNSAKRFYWQDKSRFCPQWLKIKCLFDVPYYFFFSLSLNSNLHKQKFFSPEFLFNEHKFLAKKATAKRRTAVVPKAVRRSFVFCCCCLVLLQSFPLPVRESKTGGSFCPCLGIVWSGAMLVSSCASTHYSIVFAIMSLDHLSASSHLHVQICAATCGGCHSPFSLWQMRHIRG